MVLRVLQLFAQGGDILAPGTVELVQPRRMACSMSLSEASRISIPSRSARSMCRPEARPKTTRSSGSYPRRLAPCTDTQATSHTHAQPG